MEEKKMKLLELILKEAYNSDLKEADIIYCFELAKKVFINLSKAVNKKSK